MGQCGTSSSGVTVITASPEEIAKNITIDKAGRVDSEVDVTIKKLLLLGAGESGKSTIFKQMVDLYAHGFDQQAMIEWIPVIRANLISSMQLLVKNCQKFKAEGKDGFDIAPERADDCHLLTHKDYDQGFTPKVAEAIARLWSDSAIQNAYRLRSIFHLPDGSGFLLEKTLEISKDGYVPCKDDILRARIKTTGVSIAEFKLEGLDFRVFDVGGQRNERKKWIHHFDNVSVVIFVASLSEYDQKLIEDESVNRMVESLELFDEICNSPHFTHTAFVLFLNKVDLFEKKLLEVSLSTCFPEFVGPDSLEPAYEFISSKYLALNRDKSRQIYIHPVCATSESNVQHVFNSVKETIIRKSLLKSGMLPGL